MPIYTSYLAFLKRFDYNPLKIFPKSLESVLIYYVMLNRGNNEVAPTASLLEAYKKGEIDWKTYEQDYLVSLDPKVMSYAEEWMQKRAEEAKQGHYVVLVCFEKDVQHCHRRLLAEEIVRRFGAEYKGELPSTFPE